MKRPVSTWLWGLLLIGAGLLFLLVNLDLLGSAEDWAVGLVFALGGAGFLALFALRPEAWWAAIPGFALLGLAAVIGITTTEILSEPWGGATFLGGLSLGFLAVRLRNRSAWWALIPGGVLMTLALIAGLSTTVTDERIGGILFAGITVTFGLVYLFGSARRMTWALIPAGICLVLAVGLLAGMVSVVDYVWPAVLVVVGVWMILHNRGGSRAETPGIEPQLESADQTAPQPR